MSFGALVSRVRMDDARQIRNVISRIFAPTLLGDCERNFSNYYIAPFMSSEDRRRHSLNEPMYRWTSFPMLLRDNRGE